jgi:glucokinase
MASTQPKYGLALDFGGTKLTSALVNITSGEIVASERQATPSAQGAEACLQAMVQAGQKILDKSWVPSLSIIGIGISFGGPISQDRQSVLRSHNVPDWDSFPLPEHVSKIFGLPTFMDNDGNAATLGEWYFGAGRGIENMLYIQVSTGVGAGLVLRNQIYRGQGLAAEFGHLTVMIDGPECGCGKRGCVESLTGGWALARDGKEAYIKASEDSPLKILTRLNPQVIDAELVINAYRLGDPLSRDIVERAFLFLGIGICKAIMLLDPQVVIVGGGISRAWDIMYPQLQSAMGNYLSPMFRNRVRIGTSSLHGLETLLGAALLTQGF